MQRTLQDDAPTIAKVTELYESGLSARLVGERLGVKKSLVLGFMKRNGIERRQRIGGLPKLLPDDPHTIAKVAELYETSVGIHQVADTLGVDYTVVQRFMVRNGIERRSAARDFAMGQSEADVERVKALYDSGATVAEVAESEGVDRETVRAFLKRHGINMRPTSGPESDMWIKEISYIGVHARVKRVRGRATTCTKCGTSEGRIEWAQMSEDMTDLDGYDEMCVPCHRAHDAAKRRRAGHKRTHRRFDGPTYRTLHDQVRRARGSANEYPCRECGITVDELTHNGYMQWANLTNDYHDVNDFAAMCPACHGAYDAERKRNGSFVPFEHPKELVH